MSNEAMQEVEVKLYTPNLAKARAALEGAGATLKKLRVFERNLRYENGEGSLTAQGIVLRLRQDEPVAAGANPSPVHMQAVAASAKDADNRTTDNTAKLTYKADASMEYGIVKRFEAEVAVSDFEAMDVILRRLGYAVALVYEKYRTTYELDGAEIVLDELPYGNFTEIEADAETIERVVETLGLGGCRRMSGSYTDIFAELKWKLGLEMRDCSFGAFAGVDVDLGDF